MSELRQRSRKDRSHEASGSAHASPLQAAVELCLILAETLVVDVYGDTGL